MELTDQARDAQPRAPRAMVSQLVQRVRREIEGICLWEFETRASLKVTGVMVDRVLLPAKSVSEAMTFVDTVSWTAPETAEFLVLRGPLRDEQATEPSLMLSKEGLFALASSELNDGWTAPCDRLQACLDRNLTWRGGSVLRGVPDYVLIAGPGERLAGLFNEMPRSLARQRERRASVAPGVEMSGG